MKKLMLVFLLLVSIWNVKIAFAQPEPLTPERCTQLEQPFGAIIDCQCVNRLIEALGAGLISEKQMELSLRTCVTPIQSQSKKSNPWLDLFGKAMEGLAQGGRNQTQGTMSQGSGRCPICGFIGMPEMGFNGIYYRCEKGHSWR